MFLYWLHGNTLTVVHFENANQILNKARKKQSCLSLTAATQVSAPVNSASTRGPQLDVEEGDDSA